MIDVEKFLAKCSSIGKSIPMTPDELRTVLDECEEDLI